jgi:hypothetical protein
MKTILSNGLTRSLFLLMFMATVVIAQAQTLSIKSSTVTINGETNVNHDFKINATKVNGKMTIANNRPETLSGDSCKVSYQWRKSDGQENS